MIHDGLLEHLRDDWKSNRRRLPVMARLVRAAYRGIVAGLGGPDKPGHDEKGRCHDSSQAENALVIIRTN
jgi:hypothetical protein